MAAAATAVNGRIVASAAAGNTSWLRLFYRQISGKSASAVKSAAGKPVIRSVLRI